jgi:hypothetical protein
MIRFSDSRAPHVARAISFRQTGQLVSDFCSLIRSTSLDRLKLSASGGGLYDLGSELPGYGRRFALKAPSVPLADILDCHSLRGDSMRKILLSYLLAKAVWQFYESEWMAEDWTKHTIHFMRQERGLLDHRPFLSAEFRALVSSQRLSDSDKPSRRTHIFPKVLALGIMLLEIQLGEGIETRYSEAHHDKDGALRENAGHAAAGEIIISKDWRSRIATGKIYSFVGEVIDICVKPDTGRLGTDPAHIQESLYGCIVAPLQEALVWMHECPDKCPEKLDPGPIQLDRRKTYVHHAQTAPSRETQAQTPASPQTPKMANFISGDATMLASSSTVSQQPTSPYALLTFFTGN